MARLRSLPSVLAFGFTVLVALAAYADDETPEGIGTASDPNVDESGDTSVNDDPSKADAETTRDDDAAVAVKKVVRPTKATYPVALIARPMTLTQNTAEISIDAPIVFGGNNDLGARATQVLRASYGVTQDIQVGVSYGFGAERLDPPEGLKSYEAGKAFSIDGAYTEIPDHLAVTLSLPFYADPFAMSLTLGAPFRFRLGDKLAIVGGQDLIEISLNQWPVRVAEPEFNIAEATFADMPGFEAVSSGAVNLQFGALIQLKPNVALSGYTRLHFEDFNGDDLPVPLFVGITWSKWNVDLGGRIGFESLDDGGSFGIGLSAAYRL
jgi:hypothetical protein